MRTHLAVLLTAIALPVPYLPAAEPDVFLRIPPVSGEPGEEVAVEFRATFKESLLIVFLQFSLAEEVAEYTRADAEGTASQHVAPRGVAYNPRFFRGGYMTGVRFDTQEPYGQLDPGEDLILVKAIFRIRAEAAVGDYPIHIDSAQFAFATISRSASVAIEGDGVFRVKPPTGPRPVGGLHCTQESIDVVLSWTLTQVYDSISIRRGGGPEIKVEGSVTSYRDRPPLGPASYQVRGIAGGKASMPAACEILVQPERANPPRDLACSQEGSSNHISWTNGEEYDSISLFRNGRLIAELGGKASSYSDPFSSDLLTIYTLKARARGLETPAVNCKLNEWSQTFVMWAEEVRTKPSAAGVQVRIFGTNPEVVQSLQIALRIDRRFGRIRKLTLDGTASEAAGYDQFLYQTHVLSTGETAAGIYFDTVPPAGNLLNPGADQHLMTVVVDIAADAPPGTLLPVELGTFGSPPLSNVFTVRGESRAAEVRSGALLIGDSPVPEVKDARARVEEPSGGGAGETAGGIRLSWLNGAVYTSLRIERDGKSLGEVAGGMTSFLDPGAGPGVLRYRIMARQGGRESFPVVVIARPAGVPGTFLRGDSNADRKVDLADAIHLLSHLFRGGPQPPCLDAADADDSGKIDLTDAVVILYRLFFGAGELPSPGTVSPWFDPTADDLPCD